MYALIFAVFLGYFLESIFGIGGTIIFLGIAGLFYDFKTLLYLAMGVAALASACIAAQQWRHIGWRHVLRIGLLCLPGVVIGTMLVEQLAQPLLLKCFAALLVLYGLQSLIFPHFKLPRLLRYGFVMLGGLIQGLFSTGGPFILMGYRQSFTHRGELRASMAVFFCLSNLWRIAQNEMAGGEALPVILDHAWLAIPLLLAIWLGYHIHLRLNETSFRHAMTIGLTIIGIVLLIR